MLLHDPTVSPLDSASAQQSGGISASVKIFLVVSINILRARTIFNLRWETDRGFQNSHTWNSISLPGLSRSQNATQRNRMAKFKHPEPKWSSQFVRTRTRGSWPCPSRSPHRTIQLSEGTTQKASARAYLSVRLLCLFVPSVARWIAEGWCLLCNRWPGTALNTLPELGLLLWS